MSLDSIVNVEIKKQGANITQAGFASVGLLACHSFWPERVRAFGPNILDELVDAGVGVKHPLYLMASALRAQSPSPREFRVLKRTRLPTQTWEFSPSTPVEGAVYALTVDGVALSVTAAASPTLTQILTALTTAMGALPDAEATADATTVTFAGSTPGKLHTLEAMTGNFEFADVTEDPDGGGIAQDLADAKNEDNSWYGLQIDSQSKAEIMAAAEWVEANGRLFVPSTADSECKDPTSTDDVLALIDNGNMVRTAVLFHPKPMHYAGARWMGRQLPKEPGSTNWAHQELAAEAVRLTEGEVAAILGKKGNVFTTTSGISTTYPGITGGGEWIDVTHFSDWMRVRTQERYFVLLVGLEKLAFTAGGILAAADCLRAQLFAGVRAGGIDGESPITVTVPTLEEISAADKQGRKLAGIQGRGRLAGAINTLDLTITLPVE